MSVWPKCNCRYSDLELWEAGAVSNRWQIYSAGQTDDVSVMEVPRRSKGRQIVLGQHSRTATSVRKVSVSARFVTRMDG